MAKYIIDLPDKLYAMNGELRIPIRFGESPVKEWRRTGLNVKPHTEPDRSAIEDEVWRFCMNTDWSYQEAQARYEAWKKQKEEIRVGDEVEYVCCDETVRFVVIGLIKGHTAYGFKFPCDYDDVGEYCDIDMLRKTGRHFDGVEELLSKISEESE